MKIIGYPFILLWRVWFYLLFLITVLIATPFLLIVIFDDKLYPTFYKIARIWGKTMLFGMGLKPTIQGAENIKEGRSYMLIANHTSMIDIMLMLSVVRNPFVFVGKKELTKIPIFGFIYKKTSITVDRNSAKSKKEVYDQAQKKLQSGLSVCIFPEGLVPSDESIVLSEFKNGAFRLAIEHQIPIIPMVFYDCKKRFSYTFLSGGPGKLRVRVLQELKTENKTLADREALKNEAFNRILRKLQQNM